MKRITVLTYVLLAAFGITIASCGAKRDEALVAEFNNKKTEAEKLIADATDGMKKMHDEHTAWTASLDAAAAKQGADSNAIAGFRNQLAEHVKGMESANALIDSLKAYIGAKTETNDELKAAIAGLSSNIAALTTGWKSMSDAHTKLGADITAMTTAPVAEAPKTEEKKPAPAKKAAPKPAEKQVDHGAKPVEQMDQSKHEVKVKPGGTPKK